jgi:hypothetical protein
MSTAPIGPMKRTEVVIRWPIASPFGHSRRASDSLTMTTPGASTVSCGSKKRPFSSGTPITLK